MNKILSWKIKTGVYAYIFIPNSKSYISKRITEDSPLWETIIRTIKEWKIDKYREHFDKMALEVMQKYGKIIPWNDSYFNYSDDTSIDDVNIIMLSGEGDGGESNGSDIGGGTDNGVDGGSGSGSSALDKFKDDIQNKLDAVTAAVDAKNTAVMAFVEKQVSQTVADAKNTINETVEALCAKTESAIVQLNNASDAIDKAAALFEMGEGGITTEKLQDALTAVGEYGEWMTDYSGNVINMWTDYDLANQEIGSVGEAVDGKKGLFTRIGTHIDAINTTVGTVREIADASKGLAETLASWVNESAGTVANARSWLDASAATIGQTVDFIDVDKNTTSLSSVMDALSGKIITTAMSMDEEGITNVTHEMDGKLGIISETITTLGDGLTSLGREMNAMSASMTTWITKEYSGTVKDLRDSWDTISGMVRSVSDLIIKSDDYGPIAYLLEGYNDGVRARVYKPEYIGFVSEYPWINLTNTTGYSDTEVVGEYTTEMMSYISQEANKVMMSVVDGTGLTAAIVANIEGEGDAKTAIVGVVADEMIINADTVIKAMSANSASIGGIQIGEGKIKAVEETDGDGNKIGVEDAFVLDGITGGFSATNAYIRGSISATNSSVINSVLTNVSINGSVSNPLVQFEGTVLSIKTGPQQETRFKRNSKKDVKEGSYWYYAWSHENLTLYTKSLTIQVGHGAFFINLTETNTNPSFRPTEGYEVMSIENVLNGRGGVDKHDNLIVSNYEDNKAIYFGADELEWSTKNSGRLIRIINAPTNGNASMGAVVLKSPDGMYFIENGEWLTSLKFSNEIIELFGFGTEEDFYGWIVLNRKDVNTKFPKA